MQPLQILEIRGSDADTREDLLKVLPEASYEVLGDSDEGEGFSKVRIRKRGA
jgi:TusA-related sulfurtransferase